MPTNGPALAMAGIGTLFLYSAIKGKSVLASAQAIITGQSPQNLPNANPIISNSPAVSGGTGGSVPTGGIAGDAMKYIGHAYLFGGAPGKNGKDPWDCSSFCNWVIGHDMKMAIPGMVPGGYDGSIHGPATLSWITFGKFVSHNPADAQVNDILVWQTHMGIALGNDEMVSALDPRDGTKKTSITDGSPTGELLYVRRL